MKIEFSWDEHKAETNLKKHGVAFEDATLVFYDAHALYKQDRFENGVLGILPPYIAKPSEAPVCRGL
ncbi:Uncharacterised protein [Acinetobacter johnsonii]|nr:Uncharacterised protein [Acinetobacter johnsonii]